ncbi:MAG: hypothetical protein R3B45_03030 [Bdellovibrionota bacterium]
MNFFFQGRAVRVARFCFNYLILFVFISQVLFSSLTFSQVSEQESSESKAGSVQWVLQDPVDKLVIKLGGILTHKQITLLNSGFATSSQLVAGYIGESGQPIELFRVACTVTFNDWEEVFELVKIGDKLQRFVVDSFQKYIDLCLSAEIVSQAALARLANDGGELIAQIKVEQISSSQAGKLKDWLIKQQSGVMQGLFSHMLNELKLSEDLKLSVKVPPKPKGKQAYINDKGCCWVGTGDNG